MPKSKLTVYIDHREKRGLGKALALPKFKRLRRRVKWRQMESGDVRVIQKSAVGERRVLVAIERKEADDLLNSVEDGRFYSQKKRLLEENLPRLLYLIEGKPSWFMQQRWRERGGADINIERVSNAMVRDDKILVLRTVSAARTIREIEKWVEKLIKEDDEEGDENAPKSEGKAEVSAPLFGHKIAEMTPEQFLCRILCSIPGVRHALAGSLAQEFVTVDRFIRSSAADTLEGTPYACGGKKCRLGKVVAKRMETLLGL